MKLLLGLGNPGPQYALTRHNIGFMAIEALARETGITLRQENKFQSLLGEGRLENEKVILALPLTYMNLSGEALSKIMQWYKLTLKDLLVIYDDLAFPLGTLRIRPDGSSGGHNGISSLIQHGGSAQFDRIRVGIGPMPAAFRMTDFVLGRFAKEERPALEKGLTLACDAARCVVHHGIEKAMRDYNGLKATL
jgi:PTH1 family peptidyl-tRNA hydrolase